MNNPRIQKLIVDDRLKILMAHLPCDAYQKMEERMLREGCRDPIHAWNGIILDGCDCYEICLRHGITFQVSHLHLMNYEEAVIWICMNRLDQESLSMEMRKYLIGRQYDAEKIQHSRQAGKRRLQPNPRPSGDPHVTAVRLGEYYHINHTTVALYGTYARTIDALAHKEPEIVQPILSGQFKLTHKNLVELAKLPKSEVSRICRQLHEGKPAYPNLGKQQKNVQRRLPTIKYPSKIANATLAGSIKNMPMYDADSEISSLSLTIPSWIGIIDRTFANSDFEKVSHEACKKLHTHLSCLNRSIEKIALAIREVVNHE